MATAEVSLDEFKTLFDPGTCTKKGLCPVSKIQKGTTFDTYSLYYEIHGTGPEKLIFIMGLNSTSFGWDNQVRHFSHNSAYQVLVFDNRGVGNSDSPWGPYTTSGMAEDVIALLNHVGWTLERQLHIVGISLGGMIALELATRIPNQIASVSLIATSAGGSVFSNLPPWKGLTTLARLTLMASPKEKIPLAMDMLYPKAYLESPVPNDPKRRTYWDVQVEGVLDRLEVTRPQTLVGAISQMSAGLTHHVNADRISAIARSIPRILILTGDWDNLVDPRNSKWMRDCMVDASNGVEYLVWEGVGHAIPLQEPDRFNEVLERTITESLIMLRRGTPQRV